MKTIPCEIMHDLIPLYDDKSLSDAGMKFVREHLGSCPRCRKELRDYRVAMIEDKKNDLKNDKFGDFSELRRRIASSRYIAAGIFGAVAASLIVKILVDFKTNNHDNKNNNSIE